MNSHIVASDGALRKRVVVARDRCALIQFGVD
jgi:hypothetical protein